MAVLKISKQDPELERGEKAAYNLCDVLDRTTASSTWSVVSFRGVDFVISARLELNDRPVGGPPLCEMATKVQTREAARWSREVARHLVRMQAGATFWAFPAQPKTPKFSAAYVVHVEAVPGGEGVKGHTAAIAELRKAAAQADRAARRSKPRRRRR